MTDTFFVADTHIGFDNTQRQQTVADFIAYVQSCSGDLYILGDFFEFWANNRAMFRAMLPVLEKLQGLASSGSTIGFVYGNRDFLAGSAALEPFGITCLGEQADITLGDLRVHITHGYSLCLADTAFFAYKRRMWPVFSLFDRLLPGRLEHYIARRFIIRSKQVVSEQEQSRFQFTRSAIEAHFQRGIDAVICGHTHAEETFNNGSKLFYALGCWEDTSGPYLVHRGGEFFRETFTSGS